MRSRAKAISCLVAALACGCSCVEISMASDRILSVTESTYASWNVDSSCNRGFTHINWSNPNLREAAKGLQPSRLRFGGSGNDGLVYGLTPGSPECSSIQPWPNCTYRNPTCLNATHWDALYGLAQDSGTEFIFGLSYNVELACAQGAAYEWNSTNAASLLRYTQAHNQTIWGFELGNELNLIHPWCPQTPAQQARALAKLSQMLHTSSPQSVLLGPDAGNQSWLQDYLPRAAHRLYAATTHAYGAIDLTNYNQVSQLDASLPSDTWFAAAVKSADPGTQVWGGEIGPHIGHDDARCGLESACGTYASSIWYADNLGLRARHGYSQIQRQDLFGGLYGLTNSVSRSMSLSGVESVVLSSDYWVHMLWKRAVGRNVHNLSSSDPQLRSYGFSGAPPSVHSAAECADGLQLVLVNLDTDADSVVESLPHTNSTSSEYAAWVLAPINSTASGSRALLNGQLLPDVIDVSQRSPEEFLQKLPEPVRGDVNEGLVIPPLGIAFLCY